MAGPDAMGAGYGLRPRAIRRHGPLQIGKDAPKLTVNATARRTRCLSTDPQWAWITSRPSCSLLILTIRGMVGNRERARQWYSRARELGYTEAKNRLMAPEN